MTNDDLTLLATRIMDRAERDGNCIHRSSIVEELRAGLALLVGKPFILDADGITPEDLVVMRQPRKFVIYGPGGIKPNT